MVKLIFTSSNKCRPCEVLRCGLLDNPDAPRTYVVKFDTVPGLKTESFKSWMEAKQFVLKYLRDFAVVAIDMDDGMEIIRKLRRDIMKLRRM